MASITDISRIGLSLLITISGLSLLLSTKPAEQLPRIFEELSEFFAIAKLLMPHALTYYQANAWIFVTSGLCGLLRIEKAYRVYGIAAVMYCATYDNPLLAKGSSERYLRSILLISHVCIYLCMASFAKKKKKAARKTDCSQPHLLHAHYV
eukprot:TRINITY_DN10136_c0_g1_i2.p1 TRINITY_DN10136_c0_g1~~TRINITY_DN10136_c0_g1_i2.p1  ORF type:complete len:151 (-),score=6.74 TRINITY_DN10136_c0_g1_i2:87-539(-)